MNVLVVDDEDGVRNSLRDLLGQCGVEVQECTTGRDAFAYLVEFSPDLILTDLNMPDGDGLEFIERLQRLAVQMGKVPEVVVISADQVSAESLLDAGAAAYVAKPFCLDDVRRVLKYGQPLEKRCKQKSVQFQVVAHQSFAVSTKMGSHHLSYLHLGRGGAFVPLEHSFPKVGEVVHVKTSTPLPLEFLAKVLWTRQFGTNRLASGCGVEFVEISDPHVPALEHFVKSTGVRAFVPLK